MPTWGEILQELQAVQTETKLPPYDIVRRKYLASLYNKTGRDTILYATKWTTPGASPNDITIIEEDIEGFMEVIHGLSGSNLDLIVHSPGGSPEVTEALVSYIRTKFDDVRVIVPQAAMSAATMLACSSNRILMGKHSFLGPIDPQFLIPNQNGVQTVPAQAILDQFDKARDECKDPKMLGHWMPILPQYGPALIIQCENAISLSKTLVTEWLTRYMFNGDADATQKASQIADALVNHQDLKSHGRHLSRDKVKTIGLKVNDLEDDHELQDLVLSLFHAVTHTFNGTFAVKVIENHAGKAFVKQQQPISLQMPIAQFVPTQLPPTQ